ncbi:MAG: FecR family protein [Candidatus Aureabacteria bacterium]|nr:FecR family protein [Candidatus Auribacterota bacterium]
MKRAQWAGLAAIAVTLLFAAGSYAEDEVGVFTAMKMPVTIVRENSEFAPNLSEKIYLHDVIQTGVGGQAKVLFNDNNILVITEDTTIEITKHLADTEKKWRDTLFNLKKGFIRSMLQEYSQDSLSVIQSGNAIAGVRGTDFLVRYTPASELTQVYVLDGTVEVQQRKEHIAGVTRLTANHWTDVKARNAPEQPRVLTKEAADSLRKATSITDQLSDKSRKNLKSAEIRSGAGSKGGSAAKSDMRKAAAQSGSPQVSVVGKDFILPASVGGQASIPGGRVGAVSAVSGSGSAAGRAGSSRGTVGGIVPGGGSGTGGISGITGGGGGGGGMSGIVGP